MIAPRRARSMAGLLLAVVSLGCTPAPPEPPPPSPADGAPALTDMARHQILFAGEGALLVVVFQRVREDRGAVLEAKAFLAWDGAWRDPFYERVAVEPWPGAELAPAVAAWQSARAGALRLDWTDADALHVSVRTPSAGFTLDARVTDAGTGSDPHGAVRWRSGTGALTLNGARRDGLVLVEELLPPADPAARFGAFEMWWLAPEPGVALLGRRRLSGEGLRGSDAGPQGAGEGRQDPGEALRITATGTSRVPFPVEVTATRPDAESGQALPAAWRLADAELSRAGGQVGRGPGAVYDLSHARGGGAEALVFHLQDAPREIDGAPAALWSTE